MKAQDLLDLVEFNKYGKKPPVQKEQEPDEDPPQYNDMNNTWVHGPNTYETPKTPKELGLPSISLTAEDRVTIYYPRFTTTAPGNRYMKQRLSFDPKIIMIQFGHYYGGGTYDLNSFLRSNVRARSGLDLYGGDKDGKSRISCTEMKKLYDWLDKHVEQIVKKLGGEL